jgi:hypothetical protein
VLVEKITQLVASTFGCESAARGCALIGIGVSQPENSRASVNVAITINASSIGCRPASFNTFLLMCCFSFLRNDHLTNYSKNLPIIL